MKITFDWLKDHLSTNLKEEKLLEQLPNIGLEVESVENLSAGLGVTLMSTSPLMANVFELFRGDQFGKRAIAASFLTCIGIAVALI